MRKYAVYIVTNKSRTLYTGMTGDLATRVFQHQIKAMDGFTKRYNVNTLVYCEFYEKAYDAIRREKEIKGWTRAKKIALIESVNPEWRDLSDEL